MIRQVAAIACVVLLAVATRLSACPDCPKGRIEAGDPQALLAEAEQLRQAGQFEAALRYLERAVEVTQAGGDARQAIAAQTAIGDLQAMMHRHDAARAALDEALRLARELEDPLAEARALNNLGIVLSAEKDAQTTETFTRAATLAREHGDHDLSARAELNLASYLAETDAAAAQAALQRAVGAIENAPPAQQPMLLVGLGRAWSAAGDTTRAAAALESAASDEQADPLARSYALGYLGRVRQQQGDVDTALRLSRRAAFHAQEAQSPDALYQWQWQIGRLLVTQGPAEQAIAAYRGAVRTLQTIRGDLTLGYGNERGAMTFRDRAGPMYFELADLLLRRAKDAPDTDKRDALLREARSAIELFKSSEMAEYWRDECVSQVAAAQVDIEALSPQTAVIYIIPLVERTEILVGIAGELTQFSAPIGAEPLYEQVRLLRRRLQDRSTERYLTQSRQIYDWLIRPIEGHLQSAGVSTLVFVPDGALRGIPMATLQDGKTFLIERYAIAVTPGLTLMDPKPIAGRPMELLISGLSESRHGLPELAFVPSEVQQIQEIFGGTALLDERFVTRTLASSVADTPYTIVHIASHGEFAADARKTFLATWDRKLTLDELQRIIQPNLFKGQPVELLCLSACQTAAGDDRAALGLAGVAIKSGARSALATLWSVNDQASADLIGGFYRALRDQPSIGKAEALRQAQIKIMADPRYRHPAYWSPYLIIGNWL